MPLALAPRRRWGSGGPSRSLTMNPPAGPLLPDQAITVSGTYSGPALAIVVVWLQGETPVGQPVSAQLAGGLWTAVIHAPLLPGTYRLRATLDGVVSVDSAPVAVVSANPDVAAALEFTGTGLPANVIDIFGHAFPAGRIADGAPVVLRTQGGSTLHRTQMTVLRRWPDNSVMTAVFAAELPALTAGQTASFDLVAGVAHPDPGPNLSLSTLLAGRSAVVRTWAPGNTTTPLWTFDVVQAALASTDRWQEGPLAVETRVETPVPPTAVQNTAGQTGQIASVRLIVDVLATKDG
ncbi:MAG: hypothetical protein NZ523_11295, partial [Elioraea sp.]|nr:hypothetical protein [Elioraea sp.]